MSRKSVVGKNFLWHHIVRPDAGDLVFLRDEFRFNPLDLKCISCDPSAVIAILRENYLLAIFMSPRLGKGFEIEYDELAIFFSGEYVVTISNSHIESLEHIFSGVERNPKFRNEMCSKGSSGVFCKILNGITEQTRNVVENLNEQARAYGGNPIALARVETRVRKAVNFIKQTECAINKISKSEVVYIVAEMKVCSGAVLNYLHSPRTFLISLLDEMRESYKVWRIKSINRTETLIRAVVVVLVCYAFVSIVINLLK